uniref:Uncharacterized protein n=1 Tax=Anguilla anguilla TaxID=7936 RepID=A0A0E9PGD4_ANGAN
MNISFIAIHSHYWHKVMAYTKKKMSSTTVSCMFSVPLKILAITEIRKGCVVFNMT